MILIGSRAVYQRDSTLLRRPIGNSDYDIICTPQEWEDMLAVLCEENISHEYSENKKFPGKYGLKFGHKSEFGNSLGNGYYFEVDATENPSNIELRRIVPDYCLKTKVGPFRFDVPELSILYLIKRSHANFNVYFEKTLLDLVRFQEYFLEENCDLEGIRNLYPKFYALRHQEAKDRNGERQKRINLNVPNEKFFMKSSHCRQLDHDNLHLLVAIDRKPAYLECKRDLSLAKIEKDLFFDLPFEKQIRLPIEESLVIGMEREYISKLKSLDDSFEVDEQKIYRLGLIKLIRDLSKGWFQDFCLDNIRVLWNHKEPWYDKLHSEIKTIKVQEFA